jgi:hypothetical protein
MLKRAYVVTLFTYGLELRVFEDFIANNFFFNFTLFLLKHPVDTTEGSGVETRGLIAYSRHLTARRIKCLKGTWTPYVAEHTMAFAPPCMKKTTRQMETLHRQFQSWVGKPFEAGRYIQDARW